MHTLYQKIASIQRRLVWRTRLAAVFTIAAVVIAAATLFGGMDYIVRYSDPGLRILATLAWIAVVASAICRWWNALCHRASRLAVARRIETYFPRLRDSLASAMEFLDQAEDDETAGSIQLRRLVVIEAETAVKELPIDDVVDRRPLRRAAIWFVLAALPIGTWLIIDVQSARTALVRLVEPLGRTHWPRQHHLAFRDVPERLAAGQTFEAELVDTAGPPPADVRIEFRHKNKIGGRVNSQPPIIAGDIMIARLENVQHSFAFRAVGGDDGTMPWHWVEVVQPPQLESFDILVHPPRYTGLPAATGQRHLEVLEGSEIQIRGTSSARLSLARVLLEGGQTIRANIERGTLGESAHAFHVPAGRWIAAETGLYSLELTDLDGLAVIVGKWNIRVKSDAPPSIAWQRPSDELYVTNEALIPIELTVHDDIAIQRVELVFERIDGSSLHADKNFSDAIIPLYSGPENPTPPGLGATVDEGDARSIQHSWDLGLLQLSVGTELICAAQAFDYRPAVGRTISPRRITIIAAEELESRLAERQSRIVRQIEQALSAQQAARDEVRRLVAQQRDGGEWPDGDRNMLNAAELSQRRITRDLTDPISGARATAKALLSEIEMNQLASSTLRPQMERLRDELERLAGGPLSDAERDITAARKSAEAIANIRDEAVVENASSTLADHVQRLSRSLTQAGHAQDDIVESLQRLVSELSDEADFRQIVRQLSELHQDQVAHASSTRSDVGIETIPLTASELTRHQRGKLNAAAAAQDAIANRFQTLHRAMDRLAESSAQQKSDQAGRLAEAAEMLRRGGVATDMREVSRNLIANRVGRALELQREIADELEQALNALRDKLADEHEQLVNTLRAAEAQLAALRERLETLRKDIKQSEEQPANADARHLAQLNTEQHELQQNVEKLASDLQRLQAPGAARSAQSAADRLRNNLRGDQRHTSRVPRPSASREVQQAEDDLRQAARHLAERRQQAEDDLALEFVRRFQAELAEMVRRQKQVLDETLALDSTRSSAEALAKEQAASVAKLAGEERDLAATALEYGELLYGLGAVRLSLEDANQQLAASAQWLDEGNTGAISQRAERLALVRLEGMLQAFAETISDASPGKQTPRAPNNQTPGAEPRRRPTFELLEVKMLRMLQADLNKRTRELQDRLTAVGTPPHNQAHTELLREAEELRAEQSRLSHLVQEMLSRDNEPSSE